MPNLELLSGDSEENSLAPRLGFNFWHMPTTNDSNFSQILDGLVSRNVKLVIPTRDLELPFWAKKRTFLEEHGIRVAVSSIRGVRICLDKVEFSQWGLKSNEPVIPSAVSTENLEWSPIIVKERFGAGSKGVTLSDSISDANTLSESLECPIFQPYVRGTEISVDSWFTEKSELFGFVMRTRDLVRHGESQITTTFRNQRLENVFGRFLQALGGDLNLSGPIITQAIVTNTSVGIIEVNARIGGASTVSAKVGLDLIRLSICEALNMESAPDIFSRGKFDVTQVRSMTDRHVLFDAPERLDVNE